MVAAHPTRAWCSCRARCRLLTSARPARESVDATRELRLGSRGIVVNDHAFDRIHGFRPRRGGQHPHCVRVARLPTRAYARRREVDVLRVILAVDGGSEQAHDVHRRTATPAIQFAYCGGVAQRFRHVFVHLADYVAQMMDLLLPCYVALRATRI